jgi:hypothetical protein
MTLTKKLTISALAFAILTSASSMAFSAGNKSVSKNFNAPYESVIVAAKAALTDLKLKNKGGTSFEGTTNISFSRSFSAFSVGERGTISIVNLDSGKTKVIVRSRKLNPVQITGKSTKRFARDIFAAIQARFN